MGLSITIAAGVTLFVFLYVISTSLQLLLQTTGDVAGATVRASHIDRERQSVSISITGQPQLDMAGKRIVNVTVYNSGNSGRLYDFRHFDMVLKYRIAGANNTAGVPVIDVSGYSASGQLPPAAGMWTIASITPDVVNPGIIDPGETAVLEATTRYDVYAGPGGYLQVIVSTDSGAVATKYIVY